MAAHDAVEVEAVVAAHDAVEVEAVVPAHDTIKPVVGAHDSIELVHDTKEVVVAARETITIFAQLFTLFFSQILWFPKKKTVFVQKINLNQNFLENIIVRSGQATVSRQVK